MLSDEQEKIVDLVRAGKNIFFTGVAGTGKSYLLQYCIDNVLSKRTTYVTASTGIAAVNIAGMTLHSFAGIGLGKESAEQLLRNLHFSARARWKRVSALVIDEISMIDGVLFDKLAFIAQSVRHSTAPFGGIQVIASGDFLQLKSCEKDALFTFECVSWPTVFEHVIELTKVFRQTSAPFVKALNEMRLGMMSDETCKLFESCRNKDLRSEDKIQPTSLYALRKDVQTLNDRKLAELPGSGYSFSWLTSGTSSSAICALKKNFTGVEHLRLKIEAQVILIKNLDTKTQLVNGSRGIVVDFDTNCHYPVVQFVTGQKVLIQPQIWHTSVENKVIATLVQIPLIHGWGVTIHKAQGMTLDLAQITMRGIFEYGQAYVAFSRLRSLDGLKLIDFDPNVIRAHPRAREFYENLADHANTN